jgi:hypothetical protein
VKCLYLVVRSLDPKGTGQERWMNRWKPALNAFAGLGDDGRRCREIFRPGSTHFAALGLGSRGSFTRLRHDR